MNTKATIAAFAPEVKGPLIASVVFADSWRESFRLYEASLDVVWECVEWMANHEDEGMYQEWHKWGMRLHWHFLETDEFRVMVLDQILALLIDAGLVSLEGVKDE